MKRPFALFLLTFAFLGCSAHSPATIAGPFSTAELQQFAQLNPIDAHTHIYLDDPAFYAMLRKLNLHILDILVVDNTNPTRSSLPVEEREVAQVVRAGNGRVSLCTTFDPYSFRDPGFAQTAIRQINSDFDHGAVAVKVWKNVGMQLKDTDGRYILADDPRFQPIYKDIAAHNKTLLLHTADPRGAWERLTPDSPDYLYFHQNPQWSMYGKPGAPSKEQILEARDQILNHNPALRVVGAHLGSRERDLSHLELRFDQYSNFAVDLSGRVPALAAKPRAEIIAFLTRYQDRILYGTDMEYGFGETGPRTPWEDVYARDWRFLATDDPIMIRGHTVRGLALPHTILVKIYHDNAARWYPGIANSAH